RAFQKTRATDLWTQFLAILQRKIAFLGEDTSDFPPHGFSVWSLENFSMMGRSPFSMPEEPCCSRGLKSAKGSLKEIMQFATRSEEFFPIDWYQEMLTHHPIYYHEGSDTWHVFTYENVKEVLSNYQYFSSEG